MKEGIHPNYEETTITCACGEVIKTRSKKKILRLKFVPNVILSLPENRNWLIPADVLTDLKSVLEWTNKVLIVCDSYVQNRSPML